MPDRAQAVANKLASKELGALVVTAPANIRWLTGFTGSAGVAVVGVAGSGLERHFFTDFRYDEQSAGQLGAAWERHIVVDSITAVGELLAERQSGRPLRVGFDDSELSVARMRSLEKACGEAVELIAAAGSVEDLRAVKDAAEIDAIAAAAALADSALTEVLARGLVGRTELEVATDIELTLRKNGASGVSFEPIVASGAHGALPHAVPRDVEIPTGVLVTIDWGAQLDGYASDCTRTYATGEVGEQEREIYELVLAAEQAALGACRAGISGRDLDAVARELISGAGYGEHFGHGLGHGVGLEVHEGPRLSWRSDDELQAGSVVTLEPGVYLPGVCGVRIEDLVVVEEAGARVLTGLPKQLQTIG